MATENSEQRKTLLLAGPSASLRINESSLGLTKRCQASALQKIVSSSARFRLVITTAN